MGIVCAAGLPRHRREGMHVMDDKQLPAGAQARTIPPGEFEHLDGRWGNREDWGKGPWLNEPDRVEWRMPELPGLVCLAARGPSGSWCGYVAVPPGHPLHGKGYEDVSCSVHGGLTFADRCQPGGLICHVPAPGEPDDVWWLGFDCAHGGDYSPALKASMAMAARSMLAKMDAGEEVPGFADREWLEREATPPNYPGYSDRPRMDLASRYGLCEVYRDVHYVIGEVQRLAVQMALQAAQKVPTDLIKRVFVDELPDCDEVAEQLRMELARVPGVESDS